MTVRHLIKFGGSVLTRAGARPWRSDNMRRLARELADHRNGTVLVHGTGHVGKPFAVVHDFLADGIVPPEQGEVAAEIIRALTELNAHVVDCLEREGIAASGLRPADWFPPDFSLPESHALRDRIDSELRRGRIPVLHGDLLPRPDGSHQVFSSDLITARLSALLRPELVLFLTDVDGVHATDPDDPSASAPIPVLDESSLARMFRDARDQQDVSGGMWAKTAAAREAARHAGRCVITSGIAPNRLRDVLHKRSVPGTQVIAG